MFGLMEQKRGKFLAFHLGAAGLKKKWENDNDYWDTWDKRQARGATKPAACEIGRAASGFGFAAFVALGSPCGESPTTQGIRPAL